MLVCLHVCLVFGKYENGSADGCGSALYMYGLYVAENPCDHKHWLLVKGCLSVKRVQSIECSIFFHAYKRAISFVFCATQNGRDFLCNRNHIPRTELGPDGQLGTVDLVEMNKQSADIRAIHDCIRGKHHQSSKQYSPPSIARKASYIQSMH